MRLLTVACCLMAFAASAKAQTPGEAEVPPPPPMSAESGTAEAPDPDQAPRSTQGIEPDVTIIRKDDEVIEEYRINGTLYKVKVTPSVGPSYWLLYPEGERGRAVRRELEDLQTPHWIIFSW